MAGKDRAYASATLADIFMAFGAVDERACVFADTLPGHKLSKEAF